MPDSPSARRLETPCAVPDLTRRFSARCVFLYSVDYTSSQPRQFRIVVEAIPDDQVEVRFLPILNTGEADEVVVEFPRIQSQSLNPQHALAEASRRVGDGGANWLRANNDGWVVDGDALRGMTEELTSLNWLSGTAALTPRYQAQEFLRAGGGASQGRVVLAFDEAAWVQARKPWENNWVIAREEGRSGGQGIVRRVKSRADPERAGALKVLHHEHQTSRERRYRLLRETQALDYMAGNGTPRLYETNADAFDDQRQVLYAITEFIEGPTVSGAINKKRYDLQTARTVCEHLSNTLDHLHEVGHKHRDLKPDNVILRGGSFDDPVLVDFGMASAADEDNDSFRTEANQELGNRFLRLPEYSAGAHRDDNRSDITQLVALFFYMLTGITPRLLVDSDGRRPHEREHPRLAVLKAQQQWPRLRALFDDAFIVELDKRIPDLPTLRARLKALDEPIADEETLQEIARVARVADHPDLRLHAQRHATLVAFSERFVARARDILHNTGVEIDTDDRLSPAGRHADVQIAARLRDHTWPIVHVRHHLSFDHDGWRGEFHADDGQPVEYLILPSTAEVAEIGQAIDRGATRVVKNLVRYLNYKVERVPELRATAPKPRTRLTDLLEEYPIGVRVDIAQERRALNLSFQNNSGVAQSAFAVLLLFPLAAGARIHGIPSTRQEEKYDRFTFDITTPLADRGTTAGPVVQLAGDPSTAPPDSHIFFQVKASDSQFTISIKIAEVLGQASQVSHRPLDDHLQD